jgi:hypothetical protein
VCVSSSDGMLELLHQIIARPGDAIGDREDKVRLFVANFAFLFILGAAEIALVVDSTEQSAWGFLASVNALSLVGIFGSLGLQVTLKLLLPAWILSGVCFMIALWWAAAAFGIEGQGSMFAVVAMVTPSLTFAVCQNQRAPRMRYTLATLQLTSVGGLIAAVVVHQLTLINVVPMSTVQFWVVLGTQMAIAVAASVLAGQQVVARAAEAEFIRQGQFELEERLSVAMELVREPCQSLIDLATTENPPHPATVVAANLAIQAVDDLEGVAGYNVSYATFRSAEIRPLLRTAVADVERYVTEMRHAAAHTSSASAVRKLALAQHRILGAPNSPQLSFSLRVHDGVPNYVRTDDRRLTDVVHEVAFSAASRARNMVTVIATFQAEGTWLEIRVIDDGDTLTAAQEMAVFTVQNGNHGVDKLAPRRDERVADGDSFLQRKGFLNVPISGIPRVKRIMPLLSGSLTFEKANAKRQFIGSSQSRLHSDHQSRSELDPSLAGSVYSQRHRGGHGRDVPVERGNTVLIRVRLADPEVPSTVAAGLITKHRRQRALGAMSAVDADGNSESELDAKSPLTGAASGFRSELSALSPSQLVRSVADITAKRNASAAGESWYTGRHAAYDASAHRTADVLARYFPVDDPTHGEDERSTEGAPALDPYSPRRGTNRTSSMPPVLLQQSRGEFAPASPHSPSTTPTRDDPRVIDVPPSPPKPPPKAPLAEPRVASRSHEPAEWPWLSSPAAEESARAGSWWPPPPAMVASSPRMQEMDPVRFAAKRNVAFGASATGSTLIPKFETDMPPGPPSAAPRFVPGRTRAGGLDTPQRPHSFETQEERHAMPSGRMRVAATPSPSAGVNNSTWSTPGLAISSPDDTAGFPSPSRRLDVAASPMGEAMTPVTSRNAAGIRPPHIHADALDSAATSQNGGRSISGGSIGGAATAAGNGGDNNRPPRYERGSFNGGRGSATTSEILRGERPPAGYNSLVMDAAAARARLTHENISQVPTAHRSLAGTPQQADGSEHTVRLDRFGMPIDPDL